MKQNELAFEQRDEYVGICDARYLESEYDINKLIKRHPIIEDELSYYIYDNCSSGGHKMGAMHFLHSKIQGYTMRN